MSALNDLLVYRRRVEQAEMGERNSPSFEDIEWDRLCRRRETEMHESRPWPTCCKEMQRHRGLIWALLPDRFGSMPDSPKRRRMLPEWSIQYQKPGDTWQALSCPKHCPFCGRSLPKLRLRESPPAPLCRIEDGGFYCNECGERVSNCYCYPLEAAYEVVP